MRDDTLKIRKARVRQRFSSTEDNSRPIMMLVQRGPLVMSLDKASSAQRVRLRLSKSKRFPWMFEFDMYSQNAFQPISEEENGIRFEASAAFDPAGATAIASTPVICPERLFGLLGSPPHFPLLVDEHTRTCVTRFDRRARNQPIPDIL
jgi:hypothetical protein